MAVQAMQCKAVLLCGYYGEHNLGDDALLQVLLQELPSHLQPWITANDSNVIKALAPKAQVINRRSLLETIRALFQVQGLILGGGSLLQDSTSFKSLIYYLILIVIAQQLGVPVVLWGQGLGPFRHHLSRWMVRRVLRRVQAISWRDPESFQLAQRWCLPSPMLMAPDPVWQLPSRRWQGGQAVVLCWRPTSMLDHFGWQHLLQALEIILKDIDAPVHWLAFHQRQDEQLFRQLDRQGLISSSLRSRSHFFAFDSLTDVMNQFSMARLVLPMRLHALILAQLAGSPTVALSYDPKVSSAAVMANVPFTDLQSLPDIRLLAGLWRQALDVSPDLGKIEAIRKQASQHSKILDKAFD
ncbi:polysaccharide pyruvyl transferase CsaB [Prochlorococcus marinus]|nr:polysaccharide pyruvyl transferase CsaB [Prochlorococcus marinus]